MDASRLASLAPQHEDVIRDDFADEHHSLRTGLESVEDRIAIGHQRRLDLVAIADARYPVGEEDIAARFFHQVLHMHIHLGALCRILLDLGLLVELTIFGTVEALPVPYADLFRREPVGGERGVRLHRETVDDELDLLPRIAGLLIAEAPECA